MNRGTVGVVLRVKPREDKKHSDRLTVLDNETGGATVILKKSNRSEELFQYRYHRALENATQEKTYQVCGQEVIGSCLDGYNGTIMAYGQTGSGKTHSMFGPDGIGPGDMEYHGIMPRAIRDVFNGVQRCFEWSVKMTYVEIYNETFRDLLSQSRAPISVQDSSNRSRGPTFFKGITPVIVKSAAQAFELLLEGQESRSVAAHAMNDRSSRSHAILTLWIEMTTDDGRTQKSKLNMVDLAGSERARKTGAAGSIAKEATYINKSLSCLSMVAKELRKKSSHVHYRDSKLTHYLKDSLGGNCRTLMIACVWGDANHLNETLSTCRFADDIQQVEVNVAKNSGVESVHGNLFKLNPAMTKYIDQMTAKRVAQEKAKMFRDLKRRGLVTHEEEGLDYLDDSEEKTMADEEYTELKTLRKRVKELEEMEETKKRWGVSKDDSFDELESLRKRVSELEVEKEAVQNEMAQRMKDAEGSLLEEMQELRVKVCELQKIRALTHSECSELYALRERMAQVAGRQTRNGFKKAYKTWHPNMYLSDCEMMVQDPFEIVHNANRNNPSKILNAHPESSESECTTEEDGRSSRTVEEQARVVGELEGLRDRLRELHDVAVEKLAHDNFQELSTIRDKILTYQSLPAVDPSLKDEGRHVLEELESMRGRLRDLQTIPVERMTPDNLRELAKIKDKIASLQNDDRVKAALVSRETMGQQPLVTSDSAGILFESSSENTPSSVAHHHHTLSSHLRSFLDTPHIRSRVPSPTDHNEDQSLDVLTYKNRRPSQANVLHSRDRMREMSHIPPFPGSQTDPRHQTHASSTDHSVQSSEEQCDEYPEVGCFTNEVGCFTQFSGRSEKKTSLRNKVSQHLWNLVGLGKLGGVQERQREKSFDETANIVILNSLTHGQVLELLRDRYASRPCMGSSLGSDFPYASSRTPYRPE